MIEDAALLRRFAEENSEAAFREFVARRLDFVYAAALRQVGGDTHLAQEVAQGVFLDVARKARVLAQRATITGWLYTSVRFAAAKALRSRMRRLNHETKAQAMNDLLSSSVAGPAGDLEWTELRPVLDAAMHELSEADREAILLRFFEGRSLAEVGAAVGLAENSARMRVDRALEKLRLRLVRRGITSTTAALGVALAGQPVVAAPAGFAATVAGAAIAGAGAGGGLLGGGIAIFMTTMRWKTTAGLGLIVAGWGGAVMWQRAEARLAEASALTRTQAAELTALQAEIATAATGTKSELVQERAAPKRAERGAAASGSSSDIVARLRLLMELKQRGVPGVQAPFLAEGRVQPAFSELFGLSDLEMSTVQQAADTARRQLDELAVANATGHWTVDGKFVIEVKAFAGGGPIYDELMDAMARVLGPERNAAFLTLASKAVSEGLDQFGAEVRTLTVRSGPVGADGRPTYLLDDRRKYTVEPSAGGQQPSPTPSGAQPRRGATGVTRTTSRVQPQTRAELEARYGGIVRLVPLGL